MNINAVNFHLTKYCNYKCKFCFAEFNDKPLDKGLSKLEMFEIIELCAKNNIKKISFAGGEPMLCTWLNELIIYAKKLKLTTMLVTNGHFLTEEWLKSVDGSLDWVSLSIDSIDRNSLLKIGRARGRKTLSENEFFMKFEYLKKQKIKLKINTVVNQINYKEDLREFILKAKPKRWKIFKVLPVSGQSDKTINEMTIDDVQFEFFINKNKTILRQNINMVVENNDLMTNSYLMIDPFGRFFDNSTKKLSYSKPILKVGFQNAISQISYSYEKFIERGGVWDWE